MSTGFISGKPNKYMRAKSEDEKRYWEHKPIWFRNRNEWRFYERIDLEAIYKDFGGSGNLNDEDPDIYRLVDALIGYIRIRDQVIEHRHAVMLNIGKLLNTMQRYTKDDVVRGQLQLIEEHLAQMTATSALDPEPPYRAMPDPNKD